jgi:hypothetical protein
MNQIHNKMAEMHEVFFKLKRSKPEDLWACVMAWCEAQMELDALVVRKLHEMDTGTE